MQGTRRLRHQITALRHASLGVRTRAVVDELGEGGAPAGSPAQAVLLFSNDGSVSIAQARCGALGSGPDARS